MSQNWKRLSFSDKHMRIKEMRGVAGSSEEEKLGTSAMKFLPLRRCAVKD
jgi:hypothetical protein